MKQSLPQEVYQLMQAFLHLLNTYFSKDLIEGVYIYGSTALGAFEQEKSDIDFIVLLKRTANKQEIEILKDIHIQLTNENRGARLDGMYILKDDLGKTNDTLAPYPYCSDGCLEIGRWDINHVTWWVLKEYGIVLQGTPIKELNIATIWEDVVNTLKYNMNEYWYSKVKEVRISVSDEMVESITTTICRILYSLENREIISKKRALETGLKTLPDRWHLLLKEGWRIRMSGHPQSLFETEILRAEACRDFVLYAHKFCEESYFLEG
ncbi:Nucleotidyltransferase domain-containing protein [Psychrobacillus sp. OK028]|uniref:aminoglycoside adenylyltransferase domain-containing protein n=1 Tax=Psychrobacillus sp. OK028 TaxID=1884359 RepID=UPI00088A8444|nr:aminoglycoside adenylyltransferase domain-containing protein [Psychrobacillus sp. OK028]SDN46382.1 Nucleotidyltransferase domain-containing protein [Psychrobacillus sp. OK028]